MAKKKENSEVEVLEAPVKGGNESTKMDFESFFDKNKNLAMIVFGVIIVLASSWAGYKYYTGSQDEEAQKEMFIAVNYFEQDSFDLALKGDKINRGFIDISEEYAMTKSANLSNYYIGVIYLKQGKFEDAIEYLKKFSANDFLVQARAYSLIGDAYSELNDNDNAIVYYKKASEYKPNEQFTPRYLMKLALAYELNKDYASATTTYGMIVNNYPKSQEYNDARKYQARAEEIGKE